MVPSTFANLLLASQNDSDKNRASLAREKTAVLALETFHTLSRFQLIYLRLFAVPQKRGLLYRKVSYKVGPFSFSHFVIFL